MTDLTDQKVETILLTSNKIADEILQIKGQSFNLSYQREKNREALRALKNSSGEISLLMGSFFIKVGSTDATKLISKKQEKVSNDIETTRRLLSEKVRHLRDVEKQPDCDWFDLKPLSRPELRRTCVHADDLLNLQK